MTHQLVDARFRIGRVIGRGNMGEVHQAEDLNAPENSPERTVAVKTILRRRTGGRIDATGNERPDTKVQVHLGRNSHRHALGRHPTDRRWRARYFRSAMRANAVTSSCSPRVDGSTPAATSAASAAAGEPAQPLRAARVSCGAAQTPHQRPRTPPRETRSSPAAYGARTPPARSRHSAPARTPRAAPRRLGVPMPTMRASPSESRRPGTPGARSGDRRPPTAPSRGRGAATAAPPADEDHRDRDVVGKVGDERRRFDRQRVDSQCIGRHHLQPTRHIGRVTRNGLRQRP